MLTLRTTLLILLVLAVAVCCQATPVKQPGPGCPINVGFWLQQGWYEGQVAWYSFFGSNNINWTQGLGLPLVATGPIQNNLVAFVQPTDGALYPKLGSALAGGASPIYFVTNFQQGPIFTAIPGQTDYSGLWHVNLITWKPGAIRRPIISALDLPDASEASIVAIDVVIDAPIMATGALGGPWVPAPPGRYRIPQALEVENYGPRKIIVLPAWPAYASDQVTKKPVIVYLTITDTADASLATHLGANFAPALADVDDANTERVWYFNKGQNPPPPPAQFLVLEHTVNFNCSLGSYVWFRPLNLNFDVSPVMDLQPLIRGTIPPYVTVNNPTLLQKQLISGGLLLDGDPVRINTFLSVLIRKAVAP